MITKERLLKLDKIIEKLTDKKYIATAVASRVSAKIGLKSHSHLDVADMMREQVKKLPNSIAATQLTQIADIIEANPQFCYDDFHDYFFTGKAGFTPDKTTIKECLKACRVNEVVYWYTAEGFKKYHPDLVLEVENEA